MARLDVSMPRTWQQLSQSQLRFLLQTMVKVQVANNNVGFRSADDAAAQVSAQVNTICFFAWAGMEVVCRYDDGYLVRHDGDEFKLLPGQVAAAVESLAWISSLPDIPVRLEKVDGATAAVADLSAGFSFDRWLSCEALWQSYLTSSDDACLRQMAGILYDKDDIKVDAAETLGIFYWWASVKNLVSAMFPNFFQSSASGEGGAAAIDDIRRGMDAQIRALTKGDITKESIILSMETMRALSELDAQAREYDELNKKYPKK